MMHRSKIKRAVAIALNEYCLICLWFGIRLPLGIELNPSGFSLYADLPIHAWQGIYIGAALWGYWCLYEARWEGRAEWWRAWLLTAGGPLMLLNAVMLGLSGRGTPGVSTYGVLALVIYAKALAWYEGDSIVGGKP